LVMTDTRLPMLDGYALCEVDRPHQCLGGSQRRPNGVEQPIGIERFLNRPDGV
jgi:hypothetical protein